MGGAEPQFSAPEKTSPRKVTAHAKAAQDLVRAALTFAIAATEEGVSIDGAPDPAAALYAYPKATGDDPDADLPGRLAAMVGAVPEGGRIVDREWIDKASAAYQRCKSFPE